MDSYRDKVLDALDVYYSSDAYLVFRKSMYMLGFPHQLALKYYLKDVFTDDMSIHIHWNTMPPELNARKLYPSIRSAIKEIGDDEKELEFFISDIISKFSSIASYVYPRPRKDEYDEQIAAMTLLNASRYSRIADWIKDEWRKYELHIAPGLPDGAMVKAIELRSQQYHEFIKSEFRDVVRKIIIDMHDIAALVETALLENHCTHDYFFYQKKANGVLTHYLQLNDLSIASGVNLDRIIKLNEERDLEETIPPSDLLLPELLEQINSFKNCGVWDMTKQSYPDVIVADEKTRHRSLFSGRIDFKEYAFRIDDNHNMRELGAIFYDLREMWLEVSCWESEDYLPRDECSDIKDLFRKELFQYICDVYFTYLILPKTTYFDVYTIFPGIASEEIKANLTSGGFCLTAKSFEELEEDAENAGNIYEPYAGYYRTIESTRDAKKRQKAEGQKESGKSVTLDTNVFIAELEKGKVLAGFDKDPVAAALAEVVVEASNDTTYPVEGKLADAEVYRDAHLLYGKLCGLKLIKSYTPTSYRWCVKNISDNKARSILGYLCYMMWRYFMPENDQIDRTVFCSIIQSDYDRDTIGTYARDFKKQYEITIGRVAEDGKKHKSIPSGLQKDIDKIFSDLEKEGYFRKPY